MKAMKKRVVMKPIIAVQLLVIVLLGGVGIASAFTVNTVTPGTTPWAGEATISESGDLSVTDYELVYNGELTEVTQVKVTVNNTDTSDHTADIDVAILDGTSTLQASGTAADETITASTTTEVTVSLGSNVALEDVDKLNIILTDEG